MQHPFKTNKAFQVAYSSHQEHQQRRLLTYDNMDELVVSLDGLKQQQKRGKEQAPSREDLLPPPPLLGTFTEAFMKHRGLPLHPPLEQLQPLPLLIPASNTHKLCANPSKKLSLRRRGGGGGGIARPVSQLVTSRHTVAEWQDCLFNRRNSSSTRRGLRCQNSQSQLQQNGARRNHVQALRSVLWRNQSASVMADKPSPTKLNLERETDEGVQR